MDIITCVIYNFNTIKVKKKKYKKYILKWQKSLKSLEATGSLTTQTHKDCGVCCKGAGIFDSWIMVKFGHKIFCDSKAEWL